MPTYLKAVRNTPMKKTLFSGLKPTGKLHIGNYLGTSKNWVALQEEFNTIFCIVDYHSLTINFNPDEKRAEIFEMAIDTLAHGVDPKKSIVFLQSQVSEHTELAWIFNCLVSVSELERMTQYKDHVQKKKSNINMGLLDYPVLMAADILLYKAEVVPVGEDQKQHVELARTIARKFNNKFGPYFPEPKTKLTKSARVMSLTNPTRKMAKSEGEKSYIALSDSPEIIKQKIKSATTDIGGPSGKMSGGKNLLDLLEQFSTDKNLTKKFQNDYKQGQLKYSKLKPILTEAIIETLKPIQERRNKLLKDKKYIKGVLKDGAKRAKEIANKNLQEIKRLIGIL